MFTFQMPAITELEQVVSNEVGDWKELNAAISGWLPDVREQFEMSNRQSAFRAMSNLKGVTADAEIAVLLVHPSSDNADWADLAAIAGMCRMKRLRQGAAMGLLHRRTKGPPDGAEILSLDGKPIDERHGAPLLREFSSVPLSLPRGLPGLRHAGEHDLQSAGQMRSGQSLICIRGICGSCYGGSSGRNRLMTSKHCYGHPGDATTKLSPDAATTTQERRTAIRDCSTRRRCPTAGVTQENLVENLGAGATRTGLVNSLFDPAGLSAKELRGP